MAAPFCVSEESRRHTPTLVHDRPIDPYPPTLFADLNLDSNAPIYHQIAQRIERAIRSGALQPGARLESEATTAARLRIGRATLSRAITELARRGLLSRAPGIGTFVTDAALSQRAPQGSRTIEFGHLKSRDAGARVIGRGSARVPSQIAKLLGVPRDADVLRLLQIRQSAGVLSLLETHLPLRFDVIRSVDIDRHGLHACLSALGSRARTVTETVSVRPADPVERDALHLSRRSPVLVTEQTSHDQNGIPLEHNRYVSGPETQHRQTLFVE